MIKFFRKIRQRLLTENKFSKYLLYAIGEIILVVVGILIALSINNWNENQKERKSERLILSEIRDNLKYDLNDFESNLAHLQNSLTSSKMLLKAFEDGIPYHDSLGFYFSSLEIYPHFTSKINGYSLLQSKGLELIINVDLRNKITDLYETRYPRLLTFEKERIDYIILILRDAMKPYMGNEELPLDIMPKSLIMVGSALTLRKMGFFRNIRNYEKLKQNLDFQSMVKNVEIWSSALGTIHNSVKSDALELIQQIDQELQN